MAEVLCQDLIGQNYVQTKVLSNPNLLCVIVAMRGHTTLGLAIVSIINDPTFGDQAFLDLLCAKQRSKVEGLGSLILEEAEKYAFDKGFTRINLHALTANLATNFYYRKGYKKCDLHELECVPGREASDCHAELAHLGKYDEEGGWEGYSMTKCLNSSKRRRLGVDAGYLESVESRVSDIEEYLTQVTL